MSEGENMLLGPIEGRDTADSPDSPTSYILFLNVLRLASREGQPCSCQPTAGIFHSMQYAKAWKV